MIVKLSKVRQSRVRAARRQRFKKIFSIFKPAVICLVLGVMLTWYILRSEWKTHSWFGLSVTMPDLGMVMIWLAIVFALFVYTVRGCKRMFK